MTVKNYKSIKSFAFKRLFRLYPAYAVAVILTYVTTSIIGPKELTVSFYDFIRNYMVIHVGQDLVDGSYWSLLVEIKFYAWIAICFMFLKDKFYIAVCTLGFFGTLAPHMPFFIIGISLYYWFFESNKLRTIFTLLTGAILFFMQSERAMSEIKFYNGNIAIVSAILMMIAVLSLNKNLNIQPLNYIGKISYPLYLIHQNIGVSLIQYQKSHGINDYISISLAVIICIILSTAIHYFVEIPSQKWASHYLKNNV